MFVLCFMLFSIVLSIYWSSTGPASSPSSGQVQRTVAPPSSLSTSSPRVTVRTHTGTKPSAPGNRHTFSEFSTSTRAKSDSEAVRTTSSSANASPHNYSKFGRYVPLPSVGEFWPELSYVFLYVYACSAVGFLEEGLSKNDRTGVSRI